MAASTGSRGPPVEVICVLPVQLIGSVSGGVTSFIRGLHLLPSSRPGPSAFSLSLLHMVRRRFPDAVSVLWGAAAAHRDPAVLVQRICGPMVTVGRETMKRQDKGITWSIGCLCFNVCSCIHLCSLWVYVEFKGITVKFRGKKALLMLALYLCCHAEQ